MLVRTVIQEKTGLSRRGCFALFAEKGVWLNGSLCENFKAECGQGDRIQWKSSNATREVRVGEEKKKETKVIIFHKPIGCVVARRDRFTKTIYDILPEEFRQHYRYAGRLDNDSSGLLVLTNDGDLVHQLTHPKYHFAKTYRVGLNKPLAREDAESLRSGQIVGMYDDQDDHQDSLRVSQVSGVGQEKVIVQLTEGKKRHIRRLFRHLGYRVRTLQRIGMGPLTLGSLEPGEHRPLTTEEIDLVRDSIDHAAKIS